MDAALLILSVALPWCAGCGLLLAAGWPGRGAPGAGDRPAGAVALVLGYGYFAGLLVLTVWMRLLSVAGVGFGRAAVVAPLVALGALAAYLVRWRRASRALALAASIVRPPFAGWRRLAWLLLLGWLALRFATLAVEAGTRPLYPWDAWSQWATKARVWYELGRIIPFVPADAWLAGAPGVYFDASPANPATVPLVQAWTAIMLGRWDDSATNWPWPFMLVALALAMYGMLRDRGVLPLGSLIGAYLVASLPLLDTHAALAGYADLPLCATYSLAALALYRWASGREGRDGVLAVLLALACPAIELSGSAWALTLVPGAIAAFEPRRGPRIAAWILGIVAVALVGLATGTLSIPDGILQGGASQPSAAWRSLLDSFLLADNWHLLWYGTILLAIVGARRLVAPPLAQLAIVALSGLAWVLVVAMFGNDLASWFPEARVADRAALITAPVLIFLGVLVWRELTAREAAPAPPSPASALTVDA